MAKKTRSFKRPKSTRPDRYEPYFDEDESGIGLRHNYRGGKKRKKKIKFTEE